MYESQFRQKGERNSSNYSNPLLENFMISRIWRRGRQAARGQQHHLPPRADVNRCREALNEWYRLPIREQVIRQRDRQTARDLSTIFNASFEHSHQN